MRSKACRQNSVAPSRRAAHNNCPQGGFSQRLRPGSDRSTRFRQVNASQARIPSRVAESAAQGTSEEQTTQTHNTLQALGPRRLRNSAATPPSRSRRGSLVILPLLLSISTRRDVASPMRSSAMGGQSHIILQEEHLHTRRALRQVGRCSGADGPCFNNS